MWEETIIANWNYNGYSQQYFENLIARVENNVKNQVVCPGFANWYGYYPIYTQALKNMENFLIPARKFGLKGFLVTSWGDECLFSFLKPLILACMEIAEGNGKWEDKWIALSGETYDVLKVRKLFGDTNMVNELWTVLLEGSSYHGITGSMVKEVKDKGVMNLWERVIDDIENICLPEDLDLIKKILLIGINKLRNCATVSEYLELAEIYARLWLKERKSEGGLKRAVSEFWAAAARIELETKLLNGNINTL